MKTLVFTLFAALLFVGQAVPADAYEINLDRDGVTDTFNGFYDGASLSASTDLLSFDLFILPPPILILPPAPEIIIGEAVMIKPETRIIHSSSSYSSGVIFQMDYPTIFPIDAVPTPLPAGAWLLGAGLAGLLGLRRKK